MYVQRVAVFWLGPYDAVAEGCIRMCVSAYVFLIVLVDMLFIMFVFFCFLFPS